MPIYEYVCESCEKTTEAIQRVGEEPLRICPHCGGELRKAISAPAIQFKGSGWYVTDYARAKKEEKRSASEGKEPAEKTSEARTGTEKPAEKTAEKPAKKASEE